MPPVREQMPQQEIDEQLLILRFPRGGNGAEPGVIHRFVQLRERLRPSRLQRFKRGEKRRPRARRPPGQGSAGERENFSHPSAESEPPVLRGVQQLLPEEQQLHGLARRRFGYRAAERRLFRLREKQPRRLLTAEPQSGLRPPGQKHAVARMVAADIAQRALAERALHFAKIILPEHGAPLGAVQPEVRRLARLDGGTHAFAERPGQRGVPRRALIVNIDLPADTAVVAARACRAVKRSVIRGIHLRQADPLLFPKKYITKHLARLPHM